MHPNDSSSGNPLPKATPTGATIGNIRKGKGHGMPERNTSNVGVAGTPIIKSRIISLNPEIDQTPVQSIQMEIDQRNSFHQPIDRSLITEHGDAALQRHANQSGHLSAVSETALSPILFAKGPRKRAFDRGCDNAEERAAKKELKYYQEESEMEEELDKLTDELAEELLARKNLLQDEVSVCASYHN